MSSVEEVFAAMRAVLSDPVITKKLAKRFKGSVNFTINMSNNAPTIASLDLLSTPPTFTLHSHLPKSSITVECSEGDFLLLLAGSLNPQEAFMKKRLKIKGRLGLAMKFNSVIQATKKHLPPKSKL